jgi:hypothetical protein
LTGERICELTSLEDDLIAIISNGELLDDMALLVVI